MNFFQVDSLKRVHRDHMIELLQRQMSEQLEYAKKQIDPVSIAGLIKIISYATN